jgi:tripartite-type tricarboxylate transporter receptor subunit TctC
MSLEKGPAVGEIDRGAAPPAISIASLSERLGQPFVIENRPGAINATLYDKLNFNFLRDIGPVAGINRFPIVMVVNSSFPVKTVPEFIAYAKANPGKINMASIGNGTSPHVAGELFKMTTGVNMVHVPYRGGGAALTDLLSGQALPRCWGIAPRESGGIGCLLWPRCHSGGRNTATTGRQLGRPPSPRGPR